MKSISIRNLIVSVVMVVLPCLFSGALLAEPVLGPEVRAMLGQGRATAWLEYRDTTATGVVVAGSWDMWIDRNPMMSETNLWKLNMHALALPFGRHEYKFIVNGKWEPGDNRFFYVNTAGLLEEPSDIIQQAVIQDFHMIEVFLKRPVPDQEQLRIRLEPEGEIREWHMISGLDTGYPRGYGVAGGLITFYFDEKTYEVDLPPSSRVVVAGNFNGWNGNPGPRWMLRDADNDNVWELTTQLQSLRPTAGESELLYKFVIDGKRWMNPPANAMNAAPDGKGSVNLRIDPDRGGSTMISITTKKPVDLTKRLFVVIEGLADEPLWKTTSPGKILDTFYSEKKLGVTLDKEQEATTYRLFAPRAKIAHLCFYDNPVYAKRLPRYIGFEPEKRYPMWQDPEDGIWEISLLGLDAGRFYCFNVDGPRGDGETFYPGVAIGDPYALAAAEAENCPIVIDPEATNQWFSGWTDQDFEIPARKDMVIYETHVRDLTFHPSSGVNPRLRGKYSGVLDSLGAGTGLDHLRDLGINMIEFMPVNEFNNGTTGAYNWGYTTVYYYAPEASYGLAVESGSQFYEFKNMVNELHREGFGVIMDVVYNHVGFPNLFSLIDRKYFFRLNPDWTYSNFSGCGNDVRTEAPMLRRFIVDNILYWIREHHIDGFRFDLAELIDMDTMLAIRDAVFAEHPEVILISEPWSFRGENKDQLTGTGWSAWNNDFRYAAKGFVMGERNRDRLRKCIFGSLDTWAANPLQPVNYLESHDDMALADELCTRPDHDGHQLQPDDAHINRLVATILFTSLGIPMLGEGQEFLRSKRGISNTYNKGDKLNALRWEERERPQAAEALAYYRGLIHMRKSPPGAAFRVGERPPNKYYRWITPPNEHALGYIVNEGHIHAGAAFVVLLNADGGPVDFPVGFPSGRWRMIADGKRADVSGLGGKEVFNGGRKSTIRIPGLHSAIFRDGF